jgi:[acyl-carrier-protein] S-malonyltransferase
VLFNSLGHEMGEGDTIPALLVRQVQSSVYMEDCIRRMAALGVDALVEIGPGKALTGFAKKIVPGLPVYPVETVADVQTLGDTLAALAETKTNHESEGDPA